MNFWAWFWIWVALALSALVVLAFIAKSLFNRLGEVAHQGMRLATQVEKLTEQIDKRPEIARPKDNLLDDPGLALARKRALSKAKTKKREQRQRRLIASLKHFDPNESRFH